MKKRELINAARLADLLGLSPVNSLSDTPAMKEIYAGTRGKTQGEAKETSPARKAAKTETVLSGDVIPSGLNVRADFERA